MPCSRSTARGMQQRELGADYADTSITTKDPTMLHVCNYLRLARATYTPRKGRDHSNHSGAHRNSAPAKSAFVTGSICRSRIAHPARFDQFAFRKASDRLPIVIPHGSAKLGPRGGVGEGCGPLSAAEI